MATELAAGIIVCSGEHVAKMRPAVETRHYIAECINDRSPVGILPKQRTALCCEVSRSSNVHVGIPGASLRIPQAGGELLSYYDSGASCDFGFEMVRHDESLTVDLILSYLYGGADLDTASHGVVCGQGAQPDPCCRRE